LEDELSEGILKKVESEFDDTLIDAEFESVDPLMFVELLGLELVLGAEFVVGAALEEFDGEELGAELDEGAAFGAELNELLGPELEVGLLSSRAAPPKNASMILAAAFPSLLELSEPGAAE
jgi:hypothetical protein